ncbi:putative fork head protein like protein [Calycina marina]|uniref:Fork head protein like protein n=1 Tax=Calycina marina TaxID=1763456 RepID=A0A9P8CID8_9HELO|nr:putative fork head protein like protein [Calycina marina]
MSGKRPQRERRGPRQDLVIADSSPTRPSKRRRFAPATAAGKTSPEPVETMPLPYDRVGIEMDDDHLVTAVSRILKLPDHPVAVVQEHANALHQDSNTVEAFAKLAGNDWTYYIKTVRNHIGRKPAEGAADEDYDKPIHIDLGPNKTVSRNHGMIFYNNDTQAWHLRVFGRNGIKINGTTIRKDEERILVSGQIIEVGGIEMVFVLPDPDGNQKNLDIDKAWLRKSGLIQSAAAGDETASDEDVEDSGRNGQFEFSGGSRIAPAPHGYQRPATPSSAQSRLNQAMLIGRSPYNNGTMVMHGDDVDLSLDTNMHIKPAYSYAQIISQAIFSTDDEKMTLADIYRFITDRYAFYRAQQPHGWQNSIRHNLSLNKSFVKVPRSTDEPGKGMKWMIHPDAREDMLKNSTRGGRGGIRSSSAPSSPAILGYVGRAPTVMPSGTHGSSVKRSRSRSPPMMEPYPSNGPAFTPNRGGYLLTSTQDTNTPGDDSPLPRHRRVANNSFGLSDIPGSPPALSSSRLQDDSNSFVTPAPHRVHPRLAPPSTAQKPSQGMPESSPAIFWRYAEISPMRGLESSPVKVSNMNNSTIAASSSPAPTHTASPTRTAMSMSRVSKVEEDLVEEEQGFDLTK